MADTEKPPVLVAIGSGAETDGALDVAAAEAERRRCGLRLVHVVPRASAEEAGRQRLSLVAQRLRERSAPSSRVRTEVVTGAVVPSLVALSRDASLVVLQREAHAHRHATLVHLAGVAAEASCPVLCVPPRWRRDLLDARPVGVGIEPEPAPALVRQALALARGTTGQLRLVYAPDADTAGPGRKDEAWATRVDALVRDRLGDVLEEQPDVDVEVAPWHGRPVNALLAESRECSALVVGRHHHLLPTGSHLGPVVPDLLREAACPVLVVDPVDPSEPDDAAGRSARRSTPTGWDAPLP